MQNNTNTKNFTLSDTGYFAMVFNIAMGKITNLFTTMINNFEITKIFTKFILGIRYTYHWLISDFYHLGARVTFKWGVTIENASHISLGDKVFLEKNVVLKYLEEFNDSGYKIPNLQIDDDVTVGTGTIIAAARSIHIKKNILIGPYCFIGDHDHEYKDVTTPINKQGYKDVKKIVIEEGSWIGTNSTICAGVTIGKNSVIGANSVVKSNVPPYSVAVGTPARVIKQYNFYKSRWEKISKNKNKKTNK